MSRALINDPKLAAKIRRDFIPFAGSVERLQPSRYGGRETASSRWFQKQAKLAFKEFAPAGWWENFKTYQGFYVMAPEGRAYSYQVVWKLTPSQVVEELEAALKLYRSAPPKKVRISQTMAGSQPLKPPKGTSILRVFGRIRPLPKGVARSNRGIGRDHMWVTPTEVRFMLSKGKLPETVVARLIRFQLLDNVRNVSPGFEADEIRKADFRSKLLEGKVLQFQGKFDCQGTEVGRPFTMKGHIDGRFTLDPKTNKITKCRAFAKTIASGQSTAEAPSRPYRMVFAIVEAYDSVGRSVPPTTYGISPLFRELYLHPKLK